MRKIVPKPRVKGPRFWVLFAAMGLTILIIQTFAPIIWGEPSNPVWVSLGAICAISSIVMRRRERRVE